MRVHFPELYEAHRKRDIEFLTRMATSYGLTFEQFRDSNWDNTGKVTEMSEVVEIEDGVPPPPETAAPKKRGRKPGTKNAPAQASNLIAALDFISPVKSEAYEFSKYVALHEHMAVAYNNVLSAGHPIQEELTRAADLDKLKAALNKCGRSLTITETESQISIKGDKLRALVPCLAEPLAPMRPDDCVYSGDFDGLKEAFRVGGVMASENGDRPVEASLLLNPDTVTSTNGKAMVQYYHGIKEIPPGTVIPKTFAAAIAASKKKIVGIGAIWNGEFATSFTLWFEGGAWLKTQCYEDRWPAIEHLLGTYGPATVPVMPDLFEAIGAVEPFTGDENNSIYFVDGAVQSHMDSEQGAVYEVKDLPEGKIFNAKLIKQVAPFCKYIDLTSLPDKATFFGGTTQNPIRGVLMGMIGSK